MSATGRLHLISRAGQSSTMAVFFMTVTFWCHFTYVSGIHASADKWNDFDVARALPSELREYRLYLKSTIEKVDTVIAQYETMKSKRFVPISSSLPNENSSFFKERIELLNEKKVTVLKKEFTEIVDKNAAATTDITIDTILLTSSEDSTAENSVVVNGEVTILAENITKLPLIVDVTETLGESVTDDTAEASGSEDTPIASSTTLSMEEPNFNVTTTENVETVETTTESPEIKPSSDIRSYPARKSARGRSYYGPFNPTQNRSIEECRKLSQSELVTELKQKGTYNPDLMAWDAPGVFRFLDRSIVDQYERQSEAKKNNNQTVERNVDALERLLTELNLQCNVRSPDVLSKLQKLTIAEPRRTIVSPSIRLTEYEIRVKRHTVANEWIQSFNNSRLNDEFKGKRKQHLIGDVHVVPFGCDKRGEQEDGYLRLCGACQAIRKLPDTFFPPFINEVMCDEDKACLYFYDYPHGKCKQKHMNFVVLRNVGTPQCQIWQKFNLNVRVSCECFVDEMSFFAKYV